MKAAADADNRCAAAILLDDPVRQTHGSKPLKVVDRLLGARHYDRIVLPCPGSSEPICPGEQTEVGSVRETRQSHDRQTRARRYRGSPVGAQRQTVFGIEMNVVREREHAETPGTSP